MRQLGPTGHPFEQFVAQVFLSKGYIVETNYIAKGICINHELDVIVKKDGIILVLISSLTGEEEVIEMFKKIGMNARPIDREKIPWEELIVIKAGNY